MISDLRQPIPLELPADFRGLRVLIFGLGRFGGGLGSARFFAERGAQVTITDRATAKELSSTLDQLSDLPIHAYQLGRHHESDFVEADWIVVNPAVPPKNPYLQTGINGGAQLVTEMDLFLRWCASEHVAGITGTNGKSTTTELTYRMLLASGLTAHIGGNIGRSLLCEIDRIEPAHRVVVELSSFQLDRLQPDTRRPRAVAITHYAPNHLDWHETEDAYLAAKERLLPLCFDAEGVSTMVALPAGQPHFDRWRAVSKPRRVVPFAGDLVPPGGCGFDGPWLTRTDSTGRVDSFVDFTASPLKGVASRANAACAAALAFELGASVEAVSDAVLRYRALPHRQELVARGDSLQFVNDSKATTADATASGLEAYGPNVVLLAGGSSKGTSFQALAEAIHRHARGVALYGSTADAIRESLERSGYDADRIACYETLPEAFNAAIGLSQPGDTVLLSPACASFDQFTNYEERGELFRRLVHEWCATRA